MNDPSQTVELALQQAEGKGVSGNLLRMLHTLLFARFQDNFDQRRQQLLKNREFGRLAQFIKIDKKMLLLLIDLVFGRVRRYDDLYDFIFEIVKFNAVGGSIEKQA